MCYFRSCCFLLEDMAYIVFFGWCWVGSDTGLKVELITSIVVLVATVIVDTQRLQITIRPNKYVLRNK